MVLSKEDDEVKLTFSLSLSGIASPRKFGFGSLVQGPSSSQIEKVISESVFKPFHRKLLAEKDTEQENDLFMATFATLILMRKLDIEKRVYNLRLCE